jgi:hypothetical protein
VKPQFTCYLSSGDPILLQVSYFTVAQAYSQEEERGARASPRREEGRRARIPSSLTAPLAATPRESLLHRAGADALARTGQRQGHNPQQGSHPERQLIRTPTPYSCRRWQSHLATAARSSGGGPAVGMAGTPGTRHSIGGAQARAGAGVRGRLSSTPHRASSPWHWLRRCITPSAASPSPVGRSTRGCVHPVRPKGSIDSCALLVTSSRTLELNDTLFSA